MNLYAFWALRGYTLDKLAALGEAERQFLSAVRDIYMEEVDSQWQAQ